MPHIWFPQRASQIVGHDISGAAKLSVAEVRDVSPKKLFMLLRFVVPQAVLESPPAPKRKPEEEAVAEEVAETKRSKSPQDTDR